MIKVLTFTPVSQLFVEIFEGYIPFLMYRKRTKSKLKKFDTIGSQMKYESLRDEYEGYFWFILNYLFWNFSCFFGSLLFRSVSNFREFLTFGESSTSKIPQFRRSLIFGGSFFFKVEISEQKNFTKINLAQNFRRIRGVSRDLDSIWLRDTLHMYLRVGAYCRLYCHHNRNSKRCS